MHRAVNHTNLDLCHYYKNPRASGQSGIMKSIIHLRNTVQHTVFWQRSVKLGQNLYLYRHWAWVHYYYRSMCSSTFRPRPADFLLTAKQLFSQVKQGCWQFIMIIFVVFSSLKPEIWPPGAHTPCRIFSLSDLLYVWDNRFVKCLDFLK